MTFSIFKVLFSLLPEIIALARMIRQYPAKLRDEKIIQIKKAMETARTQPGNTRNLENLINN